MNEYPATLYHDIAINEAVEIFRQETKIGASPWERWRLARECLAEEETRRRDAGAPKGGGHIGSSEHFARKSSISEIACIAVCFLAAHQRFVVIQQRLRHHGSGGNIDSRQFSIGLGFSNSQ